MNFIENESRQKLRGGYYTPLDLAQYIARWAIRPDTINTLEPSAGDGIFIDAIDAVQRQSTSIVTAIEIEPPEAAKIRRRLLNANHVDGKVLNTDFLAWAIARLTKKDIEFDAVVGNPPFIRYQYLPGDAQQRAEAIFKLLGLPFTKHTNAWVPFVLASLAMLKPGGRLGMILPSEIIHIVHAQGLRAYLSANCSRSMIVDPEELWFEQTLQGAVILFAEKKLSANERSRGLSIHKVKGKSFLDNDPNELFAKAKFVNGQTVEGKWTRALLNDGERALLDELRVHPEIHTFESIASVDVGIVTGANKFFLVPNDIVERHGLKKWAHPMFGRSDHCHGVIYDEVQHKHNAANGLPTNFLWIKGKRSELPLSVRRYLDEGESQELPSRYKCKIRTPWYTVPSVYATSVAMLKRSSDMPRLILNTMGAYTTDTAYRVTPLVPDDRLVYCFINSLTALCAELEGRHYGGGVLELVPSEIERLLVPLPAAIKRPAIRGLDKSVRALSTREVLELQDNVVLSHVGLNNAKREMLLNAWSRLRNRRQRTSGDEET